MHDHVTEKADEHIVIPFYINKRYTDQKLQKKEKSIDKVKLQVQAVFMLCCTISQHFKQIHTLIILEKLILHP